MQGGGEAWIEAGLPVFEAKARGAAAAQPQREDPLPEAVPAAYLNQLMMDRRGSFTLVDIRPADQFADYHLPASENVDPAELLENPAYLTGVGPLVIVDRNGTRAMMAAGILAQKTKRRVLGLAGGLQAYWTETQLGAPVIGAIGPVPATEAGSSAPPTPRPSGKPKRRSAGC
jgi:rhodanese-related sulfurtransferase